jgi:hypothetical protein
MCGLRHPGIPLPDNGGSCFLCMLVPLCRFTWCHTQQCMDILSTIWALPSLHWMQNANSTYSRITPVQYMVKSISAWHLLDEKWVWRNALQLSLFSYHLSSGVWGRKNSLISCLYLVLTAWTAEIYETFFAIVSCKCYQSQQTDAQTKLHQKDKSLYSSLFLLLGSSEPQFLIFPSVHFFKIKTNIDPEVRVRLPALPDVLRRSRFATGSTQPCEYNWGTTWKKK